MARSLSPMIEHYGDVKHSWDFSEPVRQTFNGIHILEIEEPYGGETLSRASEIGAPVSLSRNGNPIAYYEFDSFPVNPQVNSWEFLHDGTQDYTVSFENKSFDRASTLLSTTDESSKGFSFRTSSNSYFYCVIKNDTNETVLEYSPLSSTEDTLELFHNQSFYIDINEVNQADRFLVSIDNNSFNQFESTGTATPSLGSSSFNLVVTGSSTQTYSGELCSLNVFNGKLYYSQGLREVYQSLRLGHD